MKVPLKRATLEQAEVEARVLGRALEQRMPDGWKFLLMLFTKGEAGYMTYVSNSPKEEVRKLLLEMAGKIDQLLTVGLGGDIVGVLPCGHDTKLIKIDVFNDRRFCAGCLGEQHGNSAG